MSGSPNDIRISDMRPTLVEPPIYKPKVVLLGKDKKGRTHLIMHSFHIHSKQSFIRMFCN